MGFQFCVSRRKPLLPIHKAFSVSNTHILQQISMLTILIKNAKRVA